MTVDSTQINHEVLRNIATKCRDDLKLALTNYLEMVQAYKSEKEEYKIRIGGGEIGFTKPELLYYKLDFIQIQDELYG
jgi:hypothetical protein